MLKAFFIVVFIFFSYLSSTGAASAQENQSHKDEYFKGQVTKIENQGEIISDTSTNLFQDILVKILDGREKNKIVNVHYGDTVTLTQDQKVEVGQNLVIQKSKDSKGKTIYSIYDKYRLNNVVLIAISFAVLVLVLARLKGAGSLLGLIISLSVILFFIIPNILKGSNPLFISIIGSLIILFVTTYIAHGISKQTTIALISTFIALFITAFLAIFFSDFAHIAGIGDEEIASLQMGATSIINLKGLFLGGVIIGSLGALNDVTTTQAAAIFELEKLGDKSFISLSKRGFGIGQVHILSLVNTLVLAYAGSSLFIFIFLVLNPNNVPYWVIVNTETISGEIISTITGSSGLILAVPIVTLLASWSAIHWKKNGNKDK